MPAVCWPTALYVQCIHPSQLYKYQYNRPTKLRLLNGATKAVSHIGEVKTSVPATMEDFVHSEEIFESTLIQLSVSHLVHRVLTCTCTCTLALPNQTNLHKAALRHCLIMHRVM